VCRHVEEGTVIISVRIKRICVGMHVTYPYFKIKFVTNEIRIQVSSTSLSFSLLITRKCER
jgi:hypothetical protein